MDTKQKSALIAAAHHLKPVVMIGYKGLTSNVIAETEQAINVHELIKVKVNVADKAERQEMIRELCAAINANFLSIIGNVAIIYRKKVE